MCTISICQPKHVQKVLAFAFRANRLSVCLRDSHQAASKKARGLGRRTLQFSENRADSVDEHLAAGMRHADR